MLMIRLLGRFELRANEQPIILPSRQAQSLLAYLVLKPGVQHRREQVAGLLWPEVDESDARRRLRYALWQLRNSVGEAYFLTDRIHVAFNPQSDFWLDVAEFDRESAAELPADELLRIVSDYEGELLPGFYEDWVIRERDRLQVVFEWTMELLLGRLAEENRWREVLVSAERWIAMGQSPEPAFRALMVAHSHLGHASSAAATYQRCLETLQEQLGVEPSAETRQIYHAILSGEKPGYGDHVATRPTRPSGRETRKPLPLLWLAEERPRAEKSVFVARERELAQLDRHLEMALDGRGRVVFVLGDAGRGKSTLLSEFSRRALGRYETLVVAQGSGESHIGRGDPHLPFRDVLALLTGDVEAAWAGGLLPQEAVWRLWDIFPSSAAAVADLGPDLIDTFIPGDALEIRAMALGPEGAEWRERLGAQVALRRSRPNPVNVQHHDLQKALFDQYTRVLQRLAHQRPLLLILDDLQWADLGTVSLLFHLGRRVDGHRILVVGAYRPDEIAQGWEGQQHPLLKAQSEFKRNFGDMEIDLDQADEKEGRRFVDAFLDAEPNLLDEDFRRAFHSHTGGHPLFSIELLRQMQTQGDLQKDEQGRWVAGPTLGWDTLPARVEAVIAGRINRLPEDLKDILRTACVEGEEFTAEVVARVTGIDSPATINALSHELDQRHFLVEASGLQRVGEQRLSRYRFRHHLFQRYVYSSLDKVERAYLHEAVGEALELLYERQTEQIAVRLARHFEEAGRMEKAADYLLRAGEMAKRQSANQEAIAHLARGLRLLETLSPGPARDQRELRLQISLAAPLVATKGYTAPEAEQAYERARALCERMGDKTQLTQALWGLWSFYLVRARHFTARELAEQILGLAQLEENPDLMLLADWTTGISLAHLGHFIQAREHLERAIASYDPGRHEPLTYLYGQNPAVTCLVYLAVTLWILGFSDQALERRRQALLLAEEIAHPFSASFAHGMVAIFHSLRREAEPAFYHAQEAARRAKEAGFPFLLALGLTMRGWSRAALGKRSMTAGQMRGGLEAMEMIGAELGRPIFMFFLADAAGKAGRSAEALEAVSEALRFAEKNGERLNESDLYRLRGELLARQGDGVNESVACFRRAIEMARQQNAKSMELRAMLSLSRFWRDRGQAQEAYQGLKEIYAWFDQSSDTPDLQEAREFLLSDVQD